MVARGAGDRVVHPLPRGRARAVGELSTLHPTIFDGVRKLVRLEEKDRQPPRRHFAADQRISRRPEMRRAVRVLAGKRAIDRDPAEALSLPRIERYLPETLNELQVEQLIENIDTKVSLGLRDRAMVELLYASGLRISELANARLENFSSEEGILRV